MNKLYIDSFVEKKLTAGVQLLDEKDFSNIKEKNQLVQLVTKSNRPIGTAYISKQNKGIGWYLGPEKIDLSISYFVSLFSVAKAKRQDFA
ncbi:TPA: class I SAM-dependent rRNA methyltransferase, partial [Streptococcus pyogenes]|nr:class I SAM-dependent rRNA methyltransferase [Streptococcus pyogenes]